MAREIALIFILFISVFFDLKERRIPNWLTLWGAVIGLFINFLEGFAQFLQGLLGLTLGIGIMIVPFALGWIGAGDVKLFGTVGSLLGVQWIPRLLFYSGLTSGTLAVFAALIAGINLKGFVRLWRDMKLLIISRGQVLPEPVAERQKNSIPWAVAIAMGALIGLYLDPDGKWAGF